MKKIAKFLRKAKTDDDDFFKQSIKYTQNQVKNLAKEIDKIDNVNEVVIKRKNWLVSVNFQIRVYVNWSPRPVYIYYEITNLKKYIRHSYSFNWLAVNERNSTKNNAFFLKIDKIKKYLDEIHFKDQQALVII